MSRGKELVKNTAIVAIGKASTKFLTFFMLPFYTAVLSTEDYGVVDLFGTYVSLLLPIVVFQMEDALFRFMVDVRESQEEQQKVVTTAFLFGLMQIVIFSGMIFLVSGFVSVEYIEYLWLNVIASVLYGLLLQFTRGKGDNYGYALCGFLTVLVAVGLNIFFILGLDMRAEGMLSATVISNFVGAVYLAIRHRIWKNIRLRFFDKSLLKEMLAYCLPLVPNYLCWWIIGASDKSVVNHFLGISENGILAVSQKFSGTYTNFYSVFNITWTENAALHRYDKDSDQYYSYIIESSFRLLASACIGIIAVVAVIFPFMVNEKFGAAYCQIPIYMLSGFVYSVIGIYSVVYVAHKKTGGIALTSMIAAIVNLVVNIGLIPYIGLYAASISSVVAYTVMFLIRYFDIKKYVKIQVKKSVVVSCIGMMLLSMIVYYVRIIWLSLIFLGIVVIFACYVNRAILHELKKIIIKK